MFILSKQSTAQTEQRDCRLYSSVVDYGLGVVNYILSIEMTRLRTQMYATKSEYKERA